MSTALAPFELLPARRENVPLIIGLIGPSGSGKTYTAMRLAKGMAEGRQFAVIDTEARRARMYSDFFDFYHGDLRPPFRPDAYLAAISACRDYPVIVVDSFSHEHAGEGGVLDWQEEELEMLVRRAMERRNEGRAEWELREAFKRASWIVPKTSHKKMVQALLQVRSHLILCMRAEDKIDFVKDEATGRTKAVPMETLAGFKGWIPICDKRLPFELHMSILLLPDAPGVPHPIKLQEQHRPFFPEGKPITEESGRLLAEWAKGPLADRKAAMAAIVDALAQWPRQPPTPLWEAICRDVVGITDLDGADPAKLPRLLLFLREYLVKGSAARLRVNALAKALQQGQG